MLEVTYHPAVHSEVVRAAVHYEEESEGLGERFLTQTQLAWSSSCCSAKRWTGGTGA